MIFELTCYTLRVLRLTHYTTAEDIVEMPLISDIPFLISSVYSAKTTDNRSEIKLVYTTPFELQGQKKYDNIHHKREPKGQPFQSR